VLKDLNEKDAISSAFSEPFGTKLELFIGRFEEIVIYKIIPSTYI
jgi:hypothetical protein